MVSSAQAVTVGGGGTAGTTAVRGGNGNSSSFGAARDGLGWWRRRYGGWSRRGLHRRERGFRRRWGCLRGDRRCRGTATQGYAGGNAFQNNSANDAAGGGGGAGGAGGVGASGTGGAGGTGLPALSRDRVSRTQAAVEEEGPQAAAVAAAAAERAGRPPSAATPQHRRWRRRKASQRERTAAGGTGIVIVSYPAPASYIITATATGPGTISPAGVSAVFDGLSKTYTIAPTNPAIYCITDVRVDGVSQGPAHELHVQQRDERPHHLGDLRDLPGYGRNRSPEAATTSSTRSVHRSAPTRHGLRLHAGRSAYRGDTRRGWRGRRRQQGDHSNTKLRRRWWRGRVRRAARHGRRRRDDGRRRRRGPWGLRPGRRQRQRVLLRKHR